MYTQFNPAYFPFLITCKFNYLRWIELILCIICLVMATLIFQSNVHILIKIITTVVAGILALLCFYDCVSWLVRAQTGYVSWIMIALSGFLCLCLCAGMLLFLRRQTKKYLILMTGILVLITALVFLFDYVWTAIEYCRIRDYCKVGPCCPPQPCGDPCPPPPPQAPLYAPYNQCDDFNPCRRVSFAYHAQLKCTRDYKGRFGKTTDQAGDAGPNPQILEFTELANENSQQKIVNSSGMVFDRYSNYETKIDKEYVLPTFKYKLSEDILTPYYTCNVERKSDSKFYSKLESVPEKESRGHSIDSPRLVQSEECPTSNTTISEKKDCPVCKKPYVIKEPMRYGESLSSTQTFGCPSRTVLIKDSRRNVKVHPVQSEPKSLMEPSRIPRLQHLMTKDNYRKSDSSVPKNTDFTPPDGLTYRLESRAQHRTASSSTLEKRPLAHPSKRRIVLSEYDDRRRPFFRTRENDSEQSAESVPSSSSVKALLPYNGSKSQQREENIKNSSEVPCLCCNCASKVQLKSQKKGGPHVYCTCGKCTRNR